MMINRAAYKDSFFLPDPSEAPNMATIHQLAECRKRKMRKKVITALCVIAAAFVLSNGICYAATGETWVKRLCSSVLPNGVRVWEEEVSEGVWKGGAEFHDGDVRDAGYTVYENGRTYFVFGKFKKDITDIIAGGKDYYMYEYTDDQGILHRIFVGEMKLVEEYEGGPLIHCSVWCEQMYYSKRHMAEVGVFSGDEEWLQKARRNYPCK